MVQYPLLDDETNRILDLFSFDVIGTPEEDQFNNIANITKQGLKSQYCAINFIDEGCVCSKAMAGGDCVKVPREETFCFRILSLGEPLIVLDTFKEEQFNTNCYVTGPPFVRFYAGVPLRSENGYILGVICVFGSETREEFSSSDHSFLQYMSRFVMDELVIRKIRNRIQNVVSIERYSNDVR